MSAIHSIQDLNLLLTYKFDDAINELEKISVKGEIIDCKMCKNVLIQFNIKDGDNYMNKMKCKAWVRDGIDLQLIMSHQNTTCLVTGFIKQNYWCGGRDFVLELSEDIIFDNNNSKIKDLRKECDSNGYFHNKKHIHWNTIKRIGLISKKDTQGYNDFMTQFKIPYEIIVKEIALEGANTEVTLMAAIHELQDQVDLLLIIRGGGSTIDISSSFDKISIFETIKLSKVPIITAIGHEADKDDKLLITNISDYDYPTPTRAAIEMNRILKAPYINKLNNTLNLIQNIFTDTISSQKDEEYCKLKCYFENVVQSKFGGRIIDIAQNEKILIIHQNDLYYMMNVDLTHQVNITKDDIEIKNIIESALYNYDIMAIEKHIKSFVIDTRMLKLMKESVKEIKSIEKIEDKFAKVEPKIYKALFCKCVQLDKTDLNKLIQIYAMHLWYKDVLERLDDDKDIIEEIIEFIEV
jgi:exodeoxyribonuclease VII large subunit